jgi:glycosyltransferase involved in cell wall biosynthesis
VLLISPLQGFDPPCGDITYTETLLANPPAGVEYDTYIDAIRNGTLVERARRSRFWKEPLLTGISKCINFVRAKRWLFWEPFRFFDVHPGTYDLVHLHVFAAAFRNLDCPLVISSGAPQRDLYLNYRHHSVGSVDRMERWERRLGKLLRVNCSSYEMPQTSRTMVYTEYFRDYLVTNGYVPSELVDVVPIMHKSDQRPIVARRPTRVGFVANDFRAKGGDILLAAFEIVRRTRGDLQLIIVGSAPQLSVEEQRARGIQWVGRVERERLLNEFMPSFDIFAYPTPHDCFSYVMLEAMAAGCAIATSDYVSMPEAVDHGRAGLISPVGNSEELATNILRLADPETNLHFRQMARARFESHFSISAVSSRILQCYSAALPSGSGVRRGTVQ